MSFTLLFLLGKSGKFYDTGISKRKVCVLGANFFVFISVKVYQSLQDDKHSNER